MNSWLLGNAMKHAKEYVNWIFTVKHRTHVTSVGVLCNLLQARACAWKQLARAGEMPHQTHRRLRVKTQNKSAKNTYPLDDSALAVSFDPFQLILISVWNRSWETPTSHFAGNQLLDDFGSRCQTWPPNLKPNLTQSFFLSMEQPGWEPVNQQSWD